MERTATFSQCGRYRYRLGRRWGAPQSPAVAWIMLNPSTADAERDDPTIRRCIGFSRAWGFGGAEMVNLFALRSTDPGRLREVADPIGPGNVAHIADAARGATQVIAAWGGFALAADQGARVLDVLEGRVFCLGRTTSGAPRHPLYAPGRTRRSVFRRALAALR